MPPGKQVSLPILALFLFFHKDGLLPSVFCAQSAIPAVRKEDGAETPAGFPAAKMSIAPDIFGDAAGAAGYAQEIAGVGGVRKNQTAETLQAGKGGAMR